MIKVVDFQALPKKKLLLIEAAQDLFFKHGVYRVTVAEICNTAKVSKMTFYKYFSDKWDIAKAVLDYIINEGLKIYYAMIEEPITFDEKIERILLLSNSQVHSVGAAFLDDLMKEASPLYTYFMEQQKKVRELSIEFLQNAQEQGLIDTNIKMPVAIFMLTRLSELLNHPGFIEILPDIEDRSFEIAKIFFHAFSREPLPTESYALEKGLEHNEQKVTSNDGH
jgi:AcrR family transcriptional regulator